MDGNFFLQKNRSICETVPQSGRLRNDDLFIIFDTQVGYRGRFFLMMCLVCSVSMVIWMLANNKVFVNSDK
jgi:hypothetical protein